MTTTPNPSLEALIDDIDGSLDTLVGDADFSDDEVREALTGIRERIGFCLESL